MNKILFFVLFFLFSLVANAQENQIHKTIFIDSTTFEKSWHLVSCESDYIVLNVNFESPQKAEISYARCLGGRGIMTSAFYDSTLNRINVKIITYKRCCYTKANCLYDVIEFDEKNKGTFLFYYVNFNIDWEFLNRKFYDE